MEEIGADGGANHPEEVTGQLRIPLLVADGQTAILGDEPARHRILPLDEDRIHGDEPTSGNQHPRHGGIEGLNLLVVEVVKEPQTQDYIEWRLIPEEVSLVDIGTVKPTDPPVSSSCPFCSPH
jgi:hypothetical protein